MTATEPLPPGFTRRAAGVQRRLNAFLADSTMAREAVAICFPDQGGFVVKVTLTHWDGTEQVWRDWYAAELGGNTMYRVARNALIRAVETRG